MDDLEYIKHEVAEPRISSLSVSTVCPCGHAIVLHFAADPSGSPSVVGWTAVSPTDTDLGPVVVTTLKEKTSSRFTCPLCGRKYRAITKDSFMLPIAEE